MDAVSINDHCSGISFLLCKVLNNEAINIPECVSWRGWPFVSVGLWGRCARCRCLPKANHGQTERMSGSFRRCRANSHRVVRAGDARFRSSVFRNEHLQSADGRFDGRQNALPDCETVMRAQAHCESCIDVKRTARPLVFLGLISLMQASTSCTNKLMSNDAGRVVRQSS